MSGPVVKFHISKILLQLLPSTFYLWESSYCCLTTVIPFLLPSNFLSWNGIFLPSFLFLSSFCLSLLSFSFHKSISFSLLISEALSMFSPVKAIKDFTRGKDAQSIQCLHGIEEGKVMWKQIDNKLAQWSPWEEVRKARVRVEHGNKVERAGTGAAPMKFGTSSVLEEQGWAV